MLTWLGFSALFINGKGLEATSLEKKRDQTESICDADNQKRRFDLGWIEKSYMVGLIIVEIWGQFLHPHFFGNKLPFVPLVLVSTYCALGIMYSWCWQLWQIDS